MAKGPRPHTRHRRRRRRGSGRAQIQRPAPVRVGLALACDHCGLLEVVAPDAYAAMGQPTPADLGWDRVDGHWVCADCTEGEQC